MVARALLLLLAVTVTVASGAEVRDRARSEHALALRHKMRRVMEIAKANNCSTEERNLDDVLADILQKQAQKESALNASCQAKYDNVSAVFDEASRTAGTVKATAVATCDGSKTVEVNRAKQINNNELGNLTNDPTLAEAKANHTNAQAQCTQSSNNLVNSTSRWNGHQDSHRQKINATEQTYQDKLHEANNDFINDKNDAQTAYTTCAGTANTTKFNRNKTCTDDYNDEQASIANSYPLIKNISDLYNAWKACENGASATTAAPATTPGSVVSFVEIKEALTRKASVKCEQKQTALQKAQMATRNGLMVRGAFTSLFDTLEEDKQKSEAAYVMCQQNVTNKHVVDISKCGDDLASATDAAIKSQRDAQALALEIKQNTTRDHNAALAVHQQTYNAAVQADNRTQQMCVRVKATLDSVQQGIDTLKQESNDRYNAKVTVANNRHNNCTGRAEAARVQSVADAQADRDGNMALEKKACEDERKLLHDSFHFVNQIRQEREKDIARQQAATTTAAPETTAAETTAAATTTEAATTTAPATTTAAATTAAPVTEAATTTAAPTTAAPATTVAATTVDPNPAGQPASTIVGDSNSNAAAVNSAVNNANSGTLPTSR